MPQTRAEHHVAFQQLLDRSFPIGGLAATFVEEQNRLRPTGVEVVTGRVICSAVKRTRPGTWWHRVTIDPRHAVDEEATPLVVWIGDLQQHGGLPDLWEAPIDSSGSPEWLRINANPDRPWRPTKAMRQAVTDAHLGELPAPAGLSRERATAATTDK